MRKCNSLWNGILVLVIISLLGTACQSSDTEAENYNVLLEQLGYSQEDILLIINADDLGMHQSQSDATMELIDEGLIRSTSIMIPCPDYERIAPVLAANNNGVGIHITLTNEWQKAHPWSASLSKEEVSSLYNEDGLLYETNMALLENAKVDDVTKEMENQIKTAYESGLNITHIDSHMYSYMNDEYLGSAFALALKYKLPLLITNMNKRLMYSQTPLREFEEEMRLVIPDSYKSIYSSEDSDIIKEKYISYLKGLNPGVHVLAIHPAYMTEEARSDLDDIDLRHNDFTIWKSNEIRNIIEENNIQVISFEEIRELQMELWTDNFVDDLLAE